MKNYSPQVPSGNSGIAKQGYPPAETALAAMHKENTTASSILLLTHNTTEIEVAASGAAVAGKWISQANINASVAGTSVITAPGSANFDFIVQTNNPRRFVVPIATSANLASIQGVNRKYGLYPAVAFKTVSTAGSVMTMEF